MISNLSDEELHLQTTRAAENEENATLFLLQFLQETENRQSYLALGYHSLWDYVERGLGRSPQQTSERVSAIRLVVAVPEAMTAVTNGTLSLTTAAQVGRKIHGEKKSAEEARALFATCDGKSSRQIERILLPDASEPKPDRVRPVSKTTTSIQIEVDDEFMALLDRAKELTRETSVKKIFRFALRRVIQAKEVKPLRPRAPEVNRVKCDGPDLNEKSREAPAGGLKREATTEASPIAMRDPPSSRYIPADVRHRVRIRSGEQCEFIGRKTHERCLGRKFLEFHPLDGFAFFGEHSEENLMHVCSRHHRMLERQSRRADIRARDGV